MKLTKMSTVENMAHNCPIFNFIERGVLFPSFFIKNEYGAFSEEFEALRKLFSFFNSC